jgi:nucleotide-binding universal stress UspA family protein
MIQLFLTTILFAADDSPGATEAGRAAIALAELTGATLHVVHAWRVPEVHADPALSAHDRSFASGLYEQRGRDMLAAVLERLEAAGATIAGAELRHGPPAVAVLNEAEAVGADLIVVGSRGYGPAKRVLLGSVAEAIVRGASCPVLTVRGTPGDWPPARIIVGDDGSAEARRAGELAAAIGGAVGAGGLLIREVPVLPTTDGGDAARAAAVQRAAFDRAGRYLAHRGEELAPLLGQPLMARTTAETAAIALLEAAEQGSGPALLAVGTRGTGATGQLWLGSTAIRVLTCAPGAVLVVPHRAIAATQGCTPDTNG